jgi:hypothetical protein
MRDHGGRAGPARPPRPSRRWWRPRLAALIAMLALALTVAACGGSGKANGVASLGGSGKATATTSPGGSSDNQQAAVAFARCMRQHGVNMPDPNPDIDWSQEGRAPRWDAAWQACRQLLPPAPTPQNSRPSPQELGQLRAFAVCMRAHGIDLSDPDPTTGNMNMGGRLRGVPKDQLKDDPGYKAAEAACRDKLPGRERQRKR